MANLFKFNQHKLLKKLSIGSELMSEDPKTKRLKFEMEALSYITLISRLSYIFLIVPIFALFVRACAAGDVGFFGRNSDD